MLCELFLNTESPSSVLLLRAQAMGVLIYEMLVGRAPFVPLDKNSLQPGGVMVRAGDTSLSDLLHPARGFGFP